MIEVAQPSRCDYIAVINSLRFSSFGSIFRILAAKD